MATEVYEYYDVDFCRCCCEDTHLRLLMIGRDWCAPPDRELKVIRQAYRDYFRQRHASLRARRDTYDVDYKNVTITVFFQKYLTITFPRNISKRVFAFPQWNEESIKLLDLCKQTRASWWRIMKREMREVEWSNQSARHGTMQEHEEITWQKDAAALLNYKSMTTTWLSGILNTCLSNTVDVLSI